MSRLFFRFFKPNVIGVFLTVICLSLLPPASFAREEQLDDGELHLAAEIYGWAAGLGGNAANGADLNLSFSDVVENLDFAGMAALGARKGDFWFVTDTIYVNLENDRSGVISDIELKTWIVTPFAAYTLLEGKQGRLDILAGARMLYIDTEVSGSGERIGSFSLSDSGDNWDAIGGLRGKINLMAENFYIPFHLDAGGGDSELTWQVIGGLGYQFECLDLVAGYRYLDWEFKSNSAIDNLNVSGPYVGVNILFF